MLSCCCTTNYPVSIHQGLILIYTKSIVSSCIKAFSVKHRLCMILCFTSFVTANILHSVSRIFFFFLTKIADQEGWPLQELIVWAMWLKDLVQMIPSTCLSPDNYQHFLRYQSFKGVVLYSHCTGSDWDGVSFLHSALYGAALWICDQNDADNAPVV